MLCRELWDSAVMTALPMRVVSGSAERTVLYLAPDTAFRGARTPAGTKVRDLADWVSKDLVWVGGSLLRLAEPDTWHCVDVEFDASSEFAGWYVNFQEPGCDRHRLLPAIGNPMGVAANASGAAGCHTHRVADWEAERRIPG